MRAIYGISLALGFLALIGWLVASTVSSAVTGWDEYDPDTRFGLTGRRVVGAVFGFGMAGLSASYAGWATTVAFAAAAGGAVLGAVLAGSTE